MLSIAQCLFTLQADRVVGAQACQGRRMRDFICQQSAIQLLQELLFCSQVAERKCEHAAPAPPLGVHLHPRRCGTRWGFEIWRNRIHVHLVGQFIANK
jgi:hypothetical protein